MNDRLRKKGWLVVGAFAAMVAYLVYSHHAPGGGFIGCPFRALTGFSCFGCGMTRACAHFIHGSFAASVRYHPLGGAFVVAFGASALHYLVQNVSERPLDYAALRLWKRFEMPILVVSLVVLLVFGAVRFALEVSGILTPI